MPLLGKAIESYKEMADYGGNLGIRVTLENHWGLAADPMNIRIIIDEVNSPYCEASPDFCNWEYDYMLVSGLKALAPYAHTNVHAKYWDRWGDKNDVQRSVRIMLAAGYKGTFALEYRGWTAQRHRGRKIPLQGSSRGALVAGARRRVGALPPNSQLLDSVGISQARGAPPHARHALRATPFGLPPLRGSQRSNS